MLWGVKVNRTRRKEGNEHIMQKTCSTFVIFLKILGNHWKILMTWIDLFFKIQTLVSNNRSDCKKVRIDAMAQSSAYWKILPFSLSLSFICVFVCMYLYIYMYIWIPVDPRTTWVQIAQIHLHSDYFSLNSTIVPPDPQLLNSPMELQIRKANYKVILELVFEFMRGQHF